MLWGHRRYRRVQRQTRKRNGQQVAPLVGGQGKVCSWLSSYSLIVAIFTRGLIGSQDYTGTFLSVGFSLCNIWRITSQDGNCGEGCAFFIATLSQTLASAVSPLQIPINRIPVTFAPCGSQALLLVHLSRANGPVCFLGSSAVLCTSLWKPDCFNDVVQCPTRDSGRGLTDTRGSLG